MTARSVFKFVLAVVVGFIILFDTRISAQTTVATVRLTASDTTSGVRLIQYLIDRDRTWHTYLAPLTVTGKGLHTVTYRAVDNAGNIEATRTLRFVIDRTSPSLTAVGSAATSSPGRGARPADIILPDLVPTPSPTVPAGPLDSRAGIPWPIWRHSAMRSCSPTWARSPIAPSGSRPISRNPGLIARRCSSSRS